MKTEYLLYGKSDFDFDDRSKERMAVLNKNLRRKIQQSLAVAKEKLLKESH